MGDRRYFEVEIVRIIYDDSDEEEKTRERLKALGMHGFWPAAYTPIVVRGDTVGTEYYMQRLVIEKDDGDDDEIHD